MAGAEIQGEASSRFMTGFGASRLKRKLLGTDLNSYQPLPDIRLRLHKRPSRLWGVCGPDLAINGVGITMRTTTPNKAQVARNRGGHRR